MSRKEDGVEDSDFNIEKNADKREINARSAIASEDNKKKSILNKMLFWK